MKLLLSVISLLAMLVIPALTWGGEMRVLLVLSSDSVPYKSFANSFSRGFPSSAKLETKFLGPAEENFPINADMVVAAGIAANEIVFAKSTVPVLSVLVSRVDYEELQAEKKHAFPTSAIFLDQPLKRQTAFLYAALPKLESVGLLYTPGTRIELNSLTKQIENRGGRIVAQIVRSPETLYSSLEKVLNSSDVLLAIPDSGIYNASNIRNILLTSYRNEVPLIGYSQGYVNAGALGAIFSSPEQMAEQAIKQIQFFLARKSLDAPRYPDDFMIALNFQVARSLGIRLSTEEEISRRIREDEEGRK